MAPATEADQVWVVAHRGASSRCPENTLAAFDEALRQGCDAVEFDVQLTRDEVPVVFHDRTLDRAGADRRRVHEFSLEELRRLDASAGFEGGFEPQQIPTLDELLERYAGRTRLLVEIKTREGSAGRARHLELARRVATRVSAAAPPGSAWLLSFDSEVLDEVGRAAPELPRVANVRPLLLPGPDLRRCLPELDAVCADVRSLTRLFAASVRRAGRPLWVFTCNTPRRVKTALACHAAAIVSDRPGWLGEQLARRGLR